MFSTSASPALPPCVVVHGLDDARAVLALGLPATLLSAQGAATFAGAGWWRAVVDAATEEHPATPCRDILDCGDAPGHAMAALRLGQRILVLAPSCPAFPRVAAAARAMPGNPAILLARRPPALDFDPAIRHRPADRARRLADWLAIK